MTTLVTGGTGMLGSAVVRDLVADGRSVVAADLSTTDYYLRGRGVREGDVALERVDIVDRADLARVLEDHRVTEVIHLAAAVSMTCAEDPVTATAVNCLGTANLLEECRVRGIRRVVLASSMAVYGEDPDAMQETSSVSGEYQEGEAPFSPVAPVYGAGKAYLEALGRQYARDRGLEVAGLRCAFIASAGRPTRPPLGLVSGGYIDMVAHGRPVVVHDVDSILPWVYVDDISARLRILLDAPAELLGRGPFFNTGAVTCTVRDIVALLRDIVPDAWIEERPGRAELVLGNPKTYSDALFTDTFGVPLRYDLRAGVAAQVEAARAWRGIRLDG